MANGDLTVWSGYGHRSNIMDTEINFWIGGVLVSEKMSKKRFLVKIKYITTHSSVATGVLFAEVTFIRLLITSLYCLRRS